MYRAATVTNYPRKSTVITFAKGSVGIAAACLVMALTACSGPSRSNGGGPASRDAGGVLVAPLAVQIAEPSRLGGVNALLVAPPTMSLGASRSGMSLAQLHGLIEETARRELGLSVMGKDWLAQHSSVATLNLRNLRSNQLGLVSSQGVDAVLTTELLQFDDRVGSAAGGEPATVAFTMSVNALSDGAEVWRGTYFFRQQQLTDNLLALGDRLGSKGSGPALNSGREELERGLSSALADFGSRRQRLFLAAQAR